MSEPIKFYFSYNQIHETVRQGAHKVISGGFEPDLLLAIGGGGFIPARILRTFLKQATGRTIPIQAIGLTLYEHDDGCDPMTVAERAVRKTQWLSYGSHEAAVNLQGKNILIVDEVDDTRKTLSFAVEELLKDVAMEKATWLAARQQNKRSSCSSIALPNTPSTHSPPDSPQHCSDAAARSSTCGSSSSSSSTSDEAGPQLANAAAAAAAAAADWQEPRIGIFVVHNKLKPKKAELPLQVVNDGCYFSGCDILDHWVIYPWDAVDVWDHTDKAHSPTSATQGLISSPAAVEAAVPAPMTS